MTEPNLPDLAGVYEDIAETYAAMFMLNMKAGLVADNPAGDDDTITPPPVIAAFRDGEMVGWILGYRVDRDVALEAAQLAIFGWGCDTIMMSNDARMKLDVSKEEMENQKYERGEFQRMAQEEGSDIFGITVECMVVQTFREDGHAQMVNVVYQVRRDDEGHQWIEWQPVQSMTSGDKGKLAGVIAESVASMFERRKDVPDMAELGDAFGLPADKARVHADMAIMKLMLDAGFHVMYNANEDWKRDILAASTEHGVLSGATMLATDEAGEIGDDGKLN